MTDEQTIRLECLKYARENVQFNDIMEIMNIAHIFSEYVLVGKVPTKSNMDYTDSTGTILNLYVDGSQKSIT